MAEKLLVKNVYVSLDHGRVVFTTLSDEWV